MARSQSDLCKPRVEEMSRLAVCFAVSDRIARGPVSGRLRDLIQKVRAVRVKAQDKRGLTDFGVEPDQHVGGQNGPASGRIAAQRKARTQAQNRAACRRKPG